MGRDGFRDSTRAAIAKLPDGTGRFTDHLEHNGVSPDRLPIVADVTVSGDEITVDFSESSDHAPGAVNCSYAAEACVAYVVKLLADPTLPSNAGLTASITVKTRPGSLMAAEFPDPVANSRGGSRARGGGRGPVGARGRRVGPTGTRSATRRAGCT